MLPLNNTRSSGEDSESRLAFVGLGGKAELEERTQ